MQRGGLDLNTTRFHGERLSAPVHGQCDRSYRRRTICLCLACVTNAYNESTGKMPVTISTARLWSNKIGVEVSLKLPESFRLIKSLINCDEQPVCARRITQLPLERGTLRRDLHKQVRLQEDVATLISAFSMGLDSQGMYKHAGEY